MRRGTCLGHAGGWGLHENIKFFLLLKNFLLFFFGSYSPSLFLSPHIFSVFFYSKKGERESAGQKRSRDPLIFWPHTWLLCVQAIIWFLVEFKTHLPFKQSEFSLLQLSDVLALYNWPHIQGVLTVSRAMFVETGRYTGKTHLHSMQWHTGRYRHELMHSSMHLSTLCSSAWEISSFLIRYRQNALM